MASEIRVNKFINRSGLTTTTLTDTGVTIAGILSVSENLNVGGVLTYEDVTNVDSIGILTARTDINLGDSIIHIGDTNTKIRFPSNDTISFETGGSEGLRITSDGVIGINDTNPGTGKKVKVVVANNSSYQNAVNLTNNNNADINFYIKSGESLIAPSTNTPLCLGTGGAEKLRITTAGELEIKGSGEGGPKIFRDQGNGPDIVLHGTRGTIASPTASAGTDALGNINFAGYDGSGYHRRASINGVIDGTVSSNTVPTAIRFRTGTTTSVERLRISSSGIVTKPYQVAWAMHGSGAQNVTGGTRLNFNVNGSGFGSFSNRNHGGVNTTNNSFTVPVTGLYSITLTLFCYTDNNTNTFSIVPFKNGSQMHNGSDTIFILGASSTNANVTYSGTILLQLNANDEIDLRRRPGEAGTSRVYLPHSYFCGFLVG